MTLLKKNIAIHKQRGAALIILATILILTVIILMVGKFSQNKQRLQREAKTIERLADAKEAVIAIAMANVVLPGVLFYPDRSAGDGNFDGLEDCSGGANPQTFPNLLMGRLAFRGAGDDDNCDARVATSLDIGQSMTQGEDTYPLHYVMSQNLAEFNVGMQNSINANVVNKAGGWLTVSDENGIIIGQRVAFIIFDPGPPLTGQNRFSPIANAAQYLDNFNVPGIGVVDNSDTPVATPTPSNYVAARTSATFNDKLIFVTANEFMRRVEQAMLNRIAIQLATNFATGAYPATQAALIAGNPYNVAPFSHWLVTIAITGNTYIDNGNPGPNNGYTASITYDTADLVCGDITFTGGAVVRGINELGNQCAGANQ